MCLFRFRFFVRITCGVLVTLSFAQKLPLLLSGDVQDLPDSSILALDDHTFAIFSTTQDESSQIPVTCSHDLERWASCGHVFDRLPSWIATEIPAATKIWAPDIARVPGEYRLYYSISTFGSNDSAIGLATNPELNAAAPGSGWSDKGLVLRSRHDRDDWNAIDPNLAIDGKGQHWLVFGSFWSGIKMRKLNSRSGLLDSADQTLYSLAARPRVGGQKGAIEAPFVIRHGKYYYLFASFDFCCLKERSTNYIVVGRAIDIAGPYRDAGGKLMLKGGATVLLVGTERWRGPGHTAILSLHDKYFMTFQAYDTATKRTVLHISSLSWQHDWPVVAGLD